MNRDTQSPWPPLETMLRREHDEPLAAALERLPDDDRNLIRWHCDKGLTF